MTLPTKVSQVLSEICKTIGVSAYKRKVRQYFLGFPTDVRAFVSEDIDTVLVSRCSTKIIRYFIILVIL